MTTLDQSIRQWFRRKPLMLAAIDQMPPGEWQRLVKCVAANFGTGREACAAKAECAAAIYYGGIGKAWEQYWRQSGKAKTR